MVIEISTHNENHYGESHRNKKKMELPFLELLFGYSAYIKKK